MFSNRVFKSAENILLPKQKIEAQYDNTTIPSIYSELVTRNEEKINKNAKNIEKIAITENYTVTSKLKEMFRELIKHKRFVFNKLFAVNAHSKNEVVTAFSGLLELSRRSKVTTSQDEVFGDINVEKIKKR
jgi:chromatin segregation and condensation protein Rec8/ScpA/Scc1 (kleisin family)